MIILDSNAIIYLSKGLLAIDDAFPDGEIYAASVVTFMEVMGYPFESVQEEQLVTALFDQLRIIMIDEQIAKQVIALRKHHKIKLPDAIICATALIHQATLFTNDDRLKQIKELNIKRVNPFVV